MDDAEVEVEEFRDGIEWRWRRSEAILRLGREKVLEDSIVSLYMYNVMCQWKRECIIVDDAEGGGDTPGSIYSAGFGPYSRHTPTI